MRHGPVYARLLELGVSDRLARQWLSAYGEEQVMAKLDYVRQRKDVKSMVGYLTAALKEDYTPPEAEAKPQPTAARSERAERLRRVQAAIEARTPTQRDADKRLFASQLEDDVARGDFERFGWVSPLNIRAIFAFWEDMDPDIFEGLEPEPA